MRLFMGFEWNIMVKHGETSLWCHQTWQLNIPDSNGEQGIFRCLISDGDTVETYKQQCDIWECLKMEGSTQVVAVRIGNMMINQLSGNTLYIFGQPM